MRSKQKEAPSIKEALKVSARALAAMPKEARAAFIKGLSPKEALALQYQWEFWARPEQLEPPGDWTTWLVCSGRGWGKTKSAAEWCRKQIEEKRCSRLAMVGRTAADVRDVIVEGESGILAVCPPWNRPTYEPSKRRLTWPNGAIATLYSAEEPDTLRGPQHDGAWADEKCSWKYEETWDQLQFGLRLGARPRCIVTTTPRPIPSLKILLAESTTVVTRGTTYDNAANLAPSFLQKIVRRYEGTRLGRQELLGEVLSDTPGALWKRSAIDDARVNRAPDLVRVVVAIDPAVSVNEDSDETGIVVAGVSAGGHAFVLDDLSGLYTPHEWARRSVHAFRAYLADCLVAEKNQGGDLVLANLRGYDSSVPVRAVHAARGKAVRAEPIASLYEQGRVHHVGALPTLEDQMCTWVPGMSHRAPRPSREASKAQPGDRASRGSPDRVDALVWALTELMLTGVEDDGEGLVVVARSKR